MTAKEKILNGVELDEFEVKNLVDLWYPHVPNQFSKDHFDGIEQVDSIDGEDRRWSRTNLVVFKVDDRYFGIEWEQGLTEIQENDAFAQVAVELVKTEKTIVVTDYIRKK